MAHNVDLPQTAAAPPGEGMVTLTHVLYAMHGFSALMGLLGTAFIVTAFLSGWPSIIAVIINYVKRSDARGTWLDSHFGWQIRTFWFALLWVVIAVIVIFIPIGWPIPMGLFISWPLLIIVGLWVLYRIVRGWIALTEAKPLPLPD